MLKNKLSFCILFFILVCSISSQATTYTWDGSASNLWNTAANWDLNAVPTTGDDLIFPSGVATVSTSNDIAANTVFKSITFGAGGASTYILAGNAIGLSGGATAITASNASNTMTISLNITFSSAAPTITTTSGGTLTISGTIANGGFLLTVTSAGTANLAGAISGSGALTKDGAGALKLSTTNTFTGGVNLNVGTLNLGATQCLGTTAGTFTIAAGTSIDNVSGANLSLSNYPISLGSSFTYISTASNNLVLGSGSVTLTANCTIICSAGYLELKGVISGAFNITRSGSGNLSISNIANTYTGTTTNLGSATLYATTLKNIGEGGSSLGAPTSVANGTISLGNGATSAALLFEGSTASGANYDVVSDRVIDMAGTTGGATINILKDNGKTVSLTSNLTATGAGVKLFTLTGTNTGDNTISGIIPEPASGTVSLIKSGAGKWVLSGLNTYTVKTYIQQGTLSINTLKSVGGGASALGAPTTSANGTIAIGNGTSSATLIYTGTAQTTDRIIQMAGSTGSATIDQSGSGLIKFTSNTSTSTGVKTLTIQGSTTGTGEIAGVISNTSTPDIISVTKSGSGTWTLSGANTYTGATTISAGTLHIGAGSTSGSIASTGGIVNNAALVFNRSDASTYAGVISGTGTVENFAAGTTTLTGTNTYTGVTTISSGTIQIGAGSTTGSIASASIVNNSALAFNRSDAITYAGVISGTGTLSNIAAGTTTLTGTNTYTGVTTISSGTIQIGAGSTTGSIASASIVNNSALIINRSNALTYAGVISGSGTLDHNGAGTTTLTGSNTHSGITTITTGSIELGATNAISASRINLNGGTLTSGAGAGFSNTTTGKLGLTESSTIALGTGSHALRFDASTGSFTAAKTLTITGWLGGYNGTSGTSGQVFTGTSAELSAGELTQIRFYRASNASYYTATQLGTGEIVPTAVLPVHFAYFNGLKTAQGNELHWSTTQETDNKHFEIERGHDGINFEAIGKVNGNGTTNNASLYSYNDQTSNAILPTYYRLKQYDFNGKFECSDIVFIEGAETTKIIQVYPNPVKEGENITIQFNDADHGPADIEIFSTSGSLVQEFHIDNIRPIENLNLQAFNLKKGEYIFKIKTENKEYEAKVLVK